MQHSTTQATNRAAQKCILFMRIGRYLYDTRVNETLNIDFCIDFPVWISIIIIKTTDMVYKVSISIDWRLIHTREAQAKAICHLLKHIHVQDMFIVVPVDL